MNTLAHAIGSIAAIYLIVYAFGTLGIEILGFLGFGFAAFFLVMMWPALWDDLHVLNQWRGRGE